MTPESLAVLSPAVLRHPARDPVHDKREDSGWGKQEELLEAGFNTSYSTLILSSLAQVMQVSGEGGMA